MNYIENIKEADSGLEGQVFFSLFNKNIDLICEEVDHKYAELCTKTLNALSPEIVSELCNASVRYCNAFQAAIGQEETQYNSSKEILSKIQPCLLIVPFQEKENIPIIHLELNCEWEEEHGMEWVIRDNEILYVGAFNGVNPWSDFTKKDSWNYV